MVKKENNDDIRSKEHHPSERMSDKHWFFRFLNHVKAFFFGEKRFYRDLWLIIMTAMVVLSLATFKQNADDQKEGRKNVIAANCAINQAFLTGGQRIIRSSGGSARTNKRKKQAELAALSYAVSISTQVEQQTKVKDLVNPKTGNIDCDKLRQIAHLGN